MSKPKSKIEEADEMLYLGGDLQGMHKKKPDTSIWEDSPTTQQLASIAATLMRSRKANPELLTETAMQLWLSAQKRIRRKQGCLDAPTFHVLPPTVEQLALLAVNLASNVKDEPKSLAVAALNVWYAAGYGLIENFKLSYPLDHVRALSTTPFDGLSKDDVVSRDQFFKAVLPPSKRYRTGDVAEIGKGFLGAILRVHLKRAPTGDEIIDFYSKWNAGTPDQANLHATDFLVWYEANRVRIPRREAGKISGIVRFLQRIPGLKKEHKEKLVEAFKSIDQLLDVDLRRLVGILGSETEAERLMAVLDEARQRTRKNKD